jgi:sugar phosphate isomerase/epimerase
VIPANPDGPLVLGHFGVDHIPFKERCAAAGAAGFTGISLRYDEIHELMAREGKGAALETLARHGLKADHLELVSLPGPADRAERDERNRAYVDLALTLGVRAIHAVALDTSTPLAAVCETFGELADCAADHGLLCGIEFVPVVTATPDLPSVLEVFERCDRPNAMLVMDSFHFFRSGAPWSLLESLPSESIVTVQLNDGPMPPRSDFVWEVSCGRLLPGDGDFDLRRFLRAVDAARVDAPLTVEVMSDAMDALAPQVSISAQADAGRKLLRACAARAA